MDYVDPFHGNGEIDLPEPEGIAASWFFIKAQTGNTHPGACLPYSLISACACSGAYVTGYGLLAPNTHGRPSHRFERPCASGFAHLQPSGTGAIGTYLNYALVAPLRGGLEALGTRWALVDEEARPGSYAASLQGQNVRAELTVTPTAACHRYRFADERPTRLAVDLSAGGLDFPGTETRPSEARVERLSATETRAMLRMEGFAIYLHIWAPQASACQLWRAGEPVPEQTLALDEAQAAEGFGLLLDVEQETELRIGFSLRSAERARVNLDSCRADSFEALVQRAAETWERYLGRVSVTGGTEQQRETFYSCLYHSLIKPAALNGESPYWDDEPFYVDYATLWDQYKTLLPLMLTVWPERGAEAVNSLLSWAEHAGHFPIGLVLDERIDRFDEQARGLAQHTILDAYYRRLPDIDWQRALDLMAADLRNPRNHDFLTEGSTTRYTHTLDLADACACTARLASALGEEALAGEMGKLATRWRNVYDSTTGRLGDSTYYEGGAWNYSFRLLHDMAARIGLYADEAAFVADLDAFFGYGQPPVAQPVDPTDVDTMRWGFSLNRFEGYNNEPDIETPYNYLYAGRPERTAEVVRAGLRYLYTTGRGGLPGNDDSGGLSSCYVWNALGIFPVAGQPLMLIGSPLFCQSTLDVCGRAFTIRALENGPERIYVQSARLNGEPLERAWLWMDEFLAGGTLELRMGPQPSDWARANRPPSFPTN